MDKDREQSMHEQAPNVNLNQSTDAAVWYLLAEFSPKEFQSDHGRSDGLVAGFLSLRIQELDTLPEWVADLEAMLARFANEVWGDFEPGGPIRVFCQRKIIDEGYFERAAPHLDPAEQDMERAQAIRDLGKKMNGGWGCYAIEKGRDFTDGSCTEPCHIIEIYVYRESIEAP